jgi:hypothetical protein
MHSLCKNSSKLRSFAILIELLTIRMQFHASKAFSKCQKAEKTPINNYMDE